MSAVSRKAFLSMAERLVKPGAGSHPDVLRERTQQYGSPNLTRHLGEVPFVVVGGLATRLYMPARMTLDIDILVLRSQLTAAEKDLAGSGCRKLGALTVGGSTWRLPDGSSLDLLAPAGAWVEEAISRAVQGEDRLPYIDLPFLVIMKLSSGRVQDLADITRMMGAADDNDVQRTRGEVRKWRPGDSEDLESMIRLGRLEHDRKE